MIFDGDHGDYLGDKGDEDQLDGPRVSSLLTVGS